MEYLEPPKKDASDEERTLWIEQQADWMISNRRTKCSCSCSQPKESTIIYASDGFRCFYCLEWFCEKCAPKHFGMTREDWLGSKESGGKVIRDHNIAELASTFHTAFPSIRRILFSDIITKWKNKLK